MYHQLFSGKCLSLSGLVPEDMTSFDDQRLLEYGIGLTNLVERTTRGSGDLNTTEMRSGAAILLEKIRKYLPKIVAFNGKGLFYNYCYLSKYMNYCRNLSNVQW
jgi:TDG/mug DNA glycosylase family protein